VGASSTRHRAARKRHSLIIKGWVISSWEWGLRQGFSFLWLQHISHYFKPFKFIKTSFTIQHLIYCGTDR
jgi:hypothetical protein